MDLIYTAVTRCACGAGLARKPQAQDWNCSLVLLGVAADWRFRGALHTEPMPIVNWPLAQENHGTSTRPIRHEVSA